MAAAAPESPDNDEERIHDAQEWVVEAQAIIKDVQDCVFLLKVSDSVELSDSCVHLNLTTLEQQCYTIELSAAGFRVVSLQHDSTCSPSENYFETPYSLLDNLSPMYRVKFCSALSQRLELLAEAQRMEQ